MLFTSKILPVFRSIFISAIHLICLLLQIVFFHLRLQRRVMIPITFRLEGAEGEEEEEVIGQQGGKVS